MDNWLEFTERFPDEKSCVQYLKQIKYPNGFCCFYCGNQKLYEDKNRKVYMCPKCMKQFSIKKGTIFERSNASIRQWFFAIYLCFNSKKGISSIQLGKYIGLPQNTAWRMQQKIRKYLKEDDDIFKGIVEIDETYVGGKEKNKHSNKKLKVRGSCSKLAVIGMICRRSKKLFLKYTDEVSTKVIFDNISKYTDKKALIITDSFSVYDKTYQQREHRIVNHSAKEYANGETHTNTIEGAFSILKRSIYGIYHKVSRKHLQSYLDEVVFRYNYRDLGMGDIFSSFIIKCVNG